jgi:hypothetical protein
MPFDVKNSDSYFPELKRMDPNSEMALTYSIFDINPNLSPEANLLENLDNAIKNKEKLIYVDLKGQTALHHLALSRLAWKVSDVIPYGRGVAVALLIILGCYPQAIEETCGKSAKELFLEYGEGITDNHPVILLLDGKLDPVQYIVDTTNSDFCQRMGIEYNLLRLPEGFEQCAQEYQKSIQTYILPIAQGFFNATLKFRHLGQILSPDLDLRDAAMLSGVCKGINNSLTP